MSQQVVSRDETETDKTTDYVPDMEEMEASDNNISDMELEVANPGSSDANTNQSGTVESPQKKKNCKPMPSLWKQNKNKKLREQGKPYKHNPGRSLSTRCKCKKTNARQCSDFSELDRSNILKTVWDMTWNQKKTFVISMVDSSPGLGICDRTNLQVAAKRAFTRG